MPAAKFPVHSDLAGFDFEVSLVDCELMGTLAAAIASRKPGDSSQRLADIR